MDQVRLVAREEDTLLVDHFLHWTEAAADPAVLNLWLGEPIHPGAKGHQEFAVQIMKQFDFYSPDSACANLLVGGVAAPLLASLERH
jgi:hypothetical protein